MAREDEIKLIAYNIWEEEGCFEGRDCEHWYRAEAIWEQRQNQKAAANSGRTEPKQVESKSVKASSSTKKSRKR